MKMRRPAMKRLKLEKQRSLSNQLIWWEWRGWWNHTTASPRLCARTDHDAVPMAIATVAWIEDPKIRDRHHPVSDSHLRPPPLSSPAMNRMPNRKEDNSASPTGPAHTTSIYFRFWLLRPRLEGHSRYFQHSAASISF